MSGRMCTAGLVLALVLVPPRANAAPVPEKPGSEQINKLIQQLGSSDFAEREKATSELEKMGAAALEPLQKAAGGDDAEISRRAKALVGKVERRAAAERVLEPRRVHLVYKDTPLSEALADFQKQTGYSLQLIDPENKLKDRKVTLDTGETSFWHALTLFCQKADLVEGTMQDFWQARQGRPVIQPLPAPGNPPPAGIRKGRPPVPAQPAAPPEAVDKDKLRTKDDARPAAPAPPPPAPAAPPQAVPAQPAPPVPVQQQAQIQIQVQVQPAGPVQIMPVPGGGMVGGWGVGGGFAGPGQTTNPIYLKDGKPKDKEAACDDRTAFRVRVFDPAQRGGLPAAKDVITLGVEVRPEPRLQMIGIKQVRVDKAEDDQGQKLSTVKQQAPAQGGFPGAPPAFPGGPAAPIPPGIRRGMPMMPAAGFGMMGMGMQSLIQLEAGEKAAKSLKVLKGVATVNVISDDHPCVTVNNVLEAAGKTFKGENGASIKVVDVKDKDDAVTLKLEVQQPNQGQPGGPMPFPVILPAQIQPAVPPAKVAPPGLGGAPAQAAPVVPPAGGPGAAPPLPPAKPMPPRPAAAPVFREGFMGLTLRDDKGKSLPLNITMQAQWVGGGPPQFTYELTWKRQESKAKPSKLVMATRSQIEVEVPFTLENVPLP